MKSLEHNFLKKHIFLFLILKMHNNLPIVEVVFKLFPTPRDSEMFCILSLPPHLPTLS